MKRILIVLLLATMIGCKTMIPVNFNIKNDNHQAFAFNMAISYLEAKGYPIGDNVKQPMVVIHSSPKMLQFTLGLSKEFKGWYNPITKTVHLTVGCGPKVIVHEIKHFLLHSIGVPIELHHEIMGL